MLHLTPIIAMPTFLPFAATGRTHSTTLKLDNPHYRGEAGAGGLDVAGRAATGFNPSIEPGYQQTEPAVDTAPGLNVMMMSSHGSLLEVEVHDSQLSRRASDHLPIKARLRFDPDSNADLG